ncbi:uncharacterized protein ARMOST_17266 [Armillaria ostoyae]|uniref:Uncharacterized protein n=1 Tax=Armillaria ostoyae TaxID=47428 RepID=A0A284RYH2_ARMOS|nr:uncharacterized protein ARMOST_17266 [Armillaria ostoyae]
MTCAVKCADSPYRSPEEQETITADLPVESRLGGAIEKAIFSARQNASPHHLWWVAQKDFT